jgi:hypothetical protein
MNSILNKWHVQFNVRRPCEEVAEYVLLLLVDS